MKNKGFILFWTDAVNAILFGGLLLTGAILKWVLPHGGEAGGQGRGRGHATDAWIGLSRHEWGDIHFWIAALAVVLILFHLALHAGWIISATGKYMIGSSGRTKQPIVH